MLDLVLGSLSLFGVVGLGVIAFFWKFLLLDMTTSSNGWIV